MRVRTGRKDFTVRSWDALNEMHVRERVAEDPL